MSSILLKNGLILTYKTNENKPLAFKSDVLIQNGTIAKIEAGLEAPAGSEVVDCNGKWITPGQIDTHRHVWMSIMKGSQADWLLDEYAVKQSFGQQPKVTAEEMYIGTLAGCLEALHAGVTAVVDFCHAINSPEHATKAIEATIASGIRSKFCYAQQAGDARLLTGEEKETEEARAREWQVAQIKQLVQQGLGNEKLTDRVDLGFGYDNYFGQGPVEVHQQMLATVRELGLSPISSHYVGGPQGGKFGGHNVKSWHDAGLLAGDCLFAHANGLTHPGALPEEWDLLKTTGASIGSTPEDELGMAHGNPVAFEAVKRGVRVGLGVDYVSVQSADLFSQMRSALQFQRGHDHEELAAQGKTPLHHKHTCADAFRLATLGGAEAIHMEDKIGTIEVGKLADIIILDADESINLAGCIDPFQGYVFWAQADDVEGVLVSGEWVKKGKKLVKVQWKDVVGELKRTIAAVEARRDYENEDTIYVSTATAMGCPVQ